MKLSKKFAVAVASSALLGSLGLAGAANAASTTITAGGATFPLNLMESCRASFAGDSTSNANGDKVDYTGVGSGTGRTNFYKNTYDFAMSDSIWKTTDTSYRSSFVFMPLVGGAIDVAYNLKGIKPEGTVLQMSSATIAKIFAGQITTWNDASIKADNPVKAQPKLSALNAAAKVALAKGKKAKTATLAVSLKSSVVTKKTKNLVITSSLDGGKTVKKIYNAKPRVGTITLTVPYAVGTVYTIKYDKATLGNVSLDATTVVLPDTPITVYHRKDTSGTTNNFANYLNKIEPTIWTKPTNDAFGSAFPGTLPTDGSFVAAQGNDGVANGVMGKNGGIGYAEVSFVNERQSAGKSITAVKVKNGAGEYLPGSSAAAALFIAQAAVDSTTGVVTFNYATTATGAYPITAVSYGMANTAANGTAAKNAVAKNYVNYVLDTCAPAVAEIKGYSALPANIVAISKSIAAKIGA
jgi:phosphate transport system substrate-binding protein